MGTQGLPLEAANDTLGPGPAAPARLPGLLPTAATGWDPFEVWRTRVRDARLAPAPEPEDGAPR